MILPLLLLLTIARSFCNGESEIPGQYIIFFKEDSDKVATQDRLFEHAEQRQESQSPQILLELRQGIAVQGLTEEVAKEWANDAAVARIVPVCISVYLQ